MKNLVRLLAIAFAFTGYSQQPVNNQLIAQNTDDNRVVLSYRVEERIKMRTGSRVTTYEVSNLSQISSNDLGPDNVRIITPRYGKAKPVSAEKPKTAQQPEPVVVAESKVEKPDPKVMIEQPKVEQRLEVAPVSPAVSLAAITNAVAEPPVTAAEIVVPSVIPMAAEASAPKVMETVTVNIVDTYERILDKGYQSVDMLKKVANNRFYDGNLTAAAKWYTKLFALTTELEAEYYFRYSKSLTSINEVDKASEMMAVFEKMNNLR